jgi:SAM-dependent methyltransferase
MNALKALQTKIQKLVYGEDPEYLRRDTLNPETDSDYMLYSPTVVGYNSTAEQNFLFQNLIMGLDPTAFTVLDIGCGRGDFYGYLTEIYDHIFGYTGIDHNPIMAELAKQKYDLDIQTGAFETIELSSYDWVVAAGYFTQRKCDNKDADLEKLFADVDKMYNVANHAVTFNLLSPINNKIHEGFFYVHPGLIMDMLLEKYQFVNIRHNYSKDIYTVTIYKHQ